jgi:hypothetical protein
MNDYLNRAGRPAAQSAARVVNDQPGVVGGGLAPAKKPKKKIDWSRILFVVLAVAIAALLIAITVYSVFGKNSISAKIDTSKYQAVFLNSADGQVYFGKLKVLNDKYYELSDIYYVRVEQVQPDKNNAQAQPQQNISLAKLGNEIHGPQDFMYINRDSIMFFENLKDDGQVVKAITEYKKNPTQNNNQQNNNTNTNNNNTPAPNTNN